MSKELDDTLDDQLDYNEIEEDELHDDELDDEIQGEDMYDDEEDDDEDELTPPKTGLSPIMKGILAFAGGTVFLGVGGIAYLTLAGGNPAPVQQVQSEPTHISTQVAPDARTNMGDALNNATVNPAAQITEPDNSNQLGISDLVTPEESVRSATAVNLLENNNDSTPAIKGLDLGAPGQHATSGVSKEDLDRIKSEIEAELEEKYQAKFNAMTKSIQSEVNKKLSNSKTTSGVDEQELRKLQEELQKLKTAKLDLSKSAEIKDIYSQLDNKVSVDRLSESEKKRLIRDRSRLEGFMVLTASLDGEMSIIRTPSDRVNVFFKGERFNNAGKHVRVSDVTDGGYLVLVGSKYYIDQTYVERTQTTSKPRTTVNNKTAKKTQDSKPTTAKTVKPAKVTKSNVSDAKPAEVDSRVYRAQQINGKDIAVGWVKSGQYSQGYLVSSPSGEWLPVKIGDELPGLGRVTGEDFDGNLIVGNYVVLTAE